MSCRHRSILKIQKRPSNFSESRSCCWRFSALFYAKNAKKDFVNTSECHFARAILKSCSCCWHWSALLYTIIFQQNLLTSNRSDKKIKKRLHRHIRMSCPHRSVLKIQKTPKKISGSRACCWHLSALFYAKMQKKTSLTHQNVILHVRY